MEYIETIYQGIHDILETMTEALQHIPSQLDELRLEESFTLVIDFTQAAQSVESAVSKIVSSPVNFEEIKLDQSLSATLEAYEAGDVTQIKETIQNKLVPEFMNWRQAVEKSIQH